MVEENTYIENLILLYLKGEALPAQAEEVQNWMDESAANKNSFLAYEKAFALSHNREVFTAVNTNEAWKKVASFIHGKQKGNLRLLFGALAVAASIALVFSIFNWNTQVDPVEIAEQPVEKDSLVRPFALESYTASTEATSFALKDNSKVKLEPHSKIMLNEGFNKNNRSLTLEGSAQFTVEHKDELPFTVHVKELKVVDIGTVFNIVDKGDTVKVVVTEGIVELKLGDEDIRLIEGDSAFYVAKEAIIKKYEKPAARKDKVFEFDGMPLEDVTKVLSAFYKKDIVIMNDAIKDCELSVTFKNESLSIILNIIQELMDLEVKYNNNQYEIYGDECN